MIDTTETQAEEYTTEQPADLSKITPPEQPLPDIPPRKKVPLDLIEEPLPENQKDLRDWFYDRAMSVPLAQVPSLFRMLNLFYKISMRGMLKDNEEQFKKRIFGKEAEASLEEPDVE